ncbi:MAG TPA: GNAT family N-acetyltransferase [Bryobacteraceae bacterium]|nr:GNAT family N-acetyltransferase [Bryobacteraceae bacterium]
MGKRYTEDVDTFRIIDVNEHNVDETGFFCAMSKPKSDGFHDKLEWAKKRFREGLRIKMIAHGSRGFIEYMPGEFAWRAIQAPRYMVIHCMWVVGRTKGRGAGKALLDECIRDAREQKMAGVAAVTAPDRLGLVDTGFFLKQGFKVVDTAPPGLDLVVLKFKRAPDPKFDGGWNSKLQDLGPDLTVVYSAQCPYAHGGADQIVALANEMGLPARSLEMETVEQVHDVSPSAFAAFNIVRGGEVAVNLYHRMSGRRLARMCRGTGVVDIRAV